MPLATSMADWTSCSKSRHGSGTTSRPAHPHARSWSLLVTMSTVAPRAGRCIEHLATRPSFCSLDVHLRGNHEEVLLEFLRDATVLDAWSRFGGLETLVSYGLRPSLPLTPESLVELRLAFAAALPQHHLDFLQKTRLCFETATHYFAHAGINPSQASPSRSPRTCCGSGTSSWPPAAASRRSSSMATRRPRHRKSCPTA